jgi:hypothetical protein
MWSTSRLTLAIYLTVNFHYPTDIGYLATLLDVPSAS